LSAPGSGKSDRFLGREPTYRQYTFTTAVFGRGSVNGNISREEMAKAAKPVTSKKDDGKARKGVEWLENQMATHFANVVNVQGTREQVDLFFGTNRTWNVEDGGSVSVELSNRIILTPLAAKRLWTVLGGVLREHESRYGSLNVE
jgi:hypothetical protein